MHQNTFGGRPGSARTRWGSFSAPTEPLGRGRAKEKGGEGEKGKEERGRESEGRAMDERFAELFRGLSVYAVFQKRWCRNFAITSSTVNQF